jgi:hypothetical protein
VCDNLNTHAKGAFYKTLPPARARRLVRRIDFCYAPKHGSWLNIPDNELSSLTRECVTGRRFGDARTLRAATIAWSSDVNSTQHGVDSDVLIRGDFSLERISGFRPDLQSSTQAADLCLDR